MEILVDPEVSRAKFAREINEYRRIEDTLLHQGWLLLKAEYPNVFVILCSTHLPPPYTVAIGVDIDFTNYDLLPPSVTLTHPFTRIPYFRKEEVPIKFDKLVVVSTSQLGSQQNIAVQEQEFLQAHGDSQPFICLPGIREYHNHPAHSGDNWLLHRKRGEGTLHFILNQLYKYGVYRAVSIGVQVRLEVQYRKELE